MRMNSCSKNWDSSHSRRMPSEFHHLFHRELESGLRGLGAKSQTRTLAEIRGVNLCSNDYLGLADHPALHIAVVEAVRKATRVGGTGSRMLSGHAQSWNEFGDTFAPFVGTEAGLYFRSACDANIGVVSWLVGEAGHDLCY